MSYEINDHNEVIPYTNGRKCTDTRAWREATELELQQREELREQDSEIAKLREENQKLRDMLKRLEWCYESESYSDLCPVCFELKHKGHAPNCELAQLLEETE